MHLTFDKRVDLMTTRLLLSHKTQNVSICLQRIDRIKTILSLSQKSIKESVQNIDRDVFESDHKILFDELTIFDNID